MSTQITDNTAQILARFERNLENALEIIGGKCETYAKELCPVDTGNLRNSITHEVEGKDKKVIIGSEVEYAP